MTNTFIFAGGALLLLAVTLLLLLSPFRRRKEATEARADFSRKQLNAAIYRDELAELERDRAEGSLSQADHDQARAELQRRLLEDSADEAITAAPASSRKVPLVITLALPIGAALLYLTLGNPAALNPAPVEKQFTQSDIDKMVSALAAKLEKEPDNLKGWAMLARSFKALGRIPEALRAFERAGSLVESDPNLLLSHADTLASSVGGFDAKVNALIDKALKLDPTNAQGLWMRGTAAFENKRYDKAAADWETLLAQLEPGSEDARIVMANIDEARQKGGLGPSKKMSQIVGAGDTAPNTPTAVANAFVKGRVELAQGLASKLAAGDMLMVVARPADGSRMPLAVLRVPAKGLPLAFTLDDSLSMSPDRHLSQFPEVVIEARVSKSGQAMPQPGDLFGPAQTVKLGASDIVLKIDQVRQ